MSKKKKLYKVGVLHWGASGYTPLLGEFDDLEEARKCAVKGLVDYSEDDKFCRVEVYSVKDRCMEESFTTSYIYTADKDKN